MDNRLKNQWALVTGASRGIGKSYSNLLASKGCNLVLVARTQDELKALQNTLIKKFSIRCHVISCDLSADKAVDIIFKQIQALNLNITILISNAGIGCYGIFGKMPIERQQKMMLLNVYNPVVMTHRFINQANDANSHYYIIQIGSIVGYKPLPGSCVYNASKSFIVSFVKALNVELRLNYKNISATVVSPGVTKTNFFKDANKVLPKINALITMSPDDVAKIGLQAMLKKKSSVICGVRNKLLVLLMQFIPISWLIAYMFVLMPR